MNNPHDSHPPAPAAAKESFLKERGPLLVMIASGLLLVVSVLALVVYFFFLPKKVAARPLILIHSPSNEAELEIGAAALIHATARDENGITRIEFWVDDILQEVETSGAEDGITPFPMLVSWIPESEGDHTLTFRAFNSQRTRAYTSIVVEGILGSDRDGDGVDDSVDACPDIPGGGEDGCSIPGDADGDGVVDEDDLCPAEPGEADDLGCPDRDGDGVPDHLDADPDEPGPAETDGAPDRDGDGVPDIEDLRPDEPGAPESGGAPDTGAGDRDGDGAPDDVDPCPDDPGAPEDGYCPSPRDDAPPEDDDPAGGEPPEAIRVINLEVEAYYFRVDQDYDRVWCYVQLGDALIDRYEFAPQGEQQWDIDRVLAGENSARVLVPANEDLRVLLECEAAPLPLGPGEGEPALVPLGTYEAFHSPAEWDGRELLATGFGLEEASFVSRYRICSHSCDEVEIQPPVLHPITTGPRGEGPYHLYWGWDGDEDWLEGFTMLVNSNLLDSVAEISPERRSLDIGELLPECGEVLEFQMRAFGANPGDGVVFQSPPSNIQVWDGRTCPRTVMVSFISLDPAGRSGRDGPIYGSFYANDRRLEAAFREGRASFDATDDPEWYLDRIISIPLMFEEIEREAWSCIGNNCTSNYAPDSSAIEVELGAREALTFGASIWTERDGRLFEGFETIPAGEIAPGIYQVNDNGIRMEVAVDVLVGPEAGGEEHLPDLVVTGVSQQEESGQLQIHVFNNAADLVSEDITISVVQISTGEEIYLNTWENITIPAGGRRILGTYDFRAEPHDLRILIDPVDPASGSDGIRETNELNNVYQTPVRMQIQINSFRPGDPCESFLDMVAEFKFRIWVGHLSPGGEITWVGERNHPWAGTIDVDHTDYPWTYLGEWDIRDNDLYLFEFDMPPDHSLVIRADGTEDDPGLAADDFAGSVDVSYSAPENYGASTEEYHYASEGWHECHDGTPLGWDTNNFHIWWNINRIY